jgi:hypothetical protein
MSEARSIQYSPWSIDEGSKYELCFPCTQKGKHFRGELLRRYVTGRDGDMHREYKIRCPLCGRSTEAHRSKMVTELEWEAKQQPGDGLKHRDQKKSNA